RHPCWHRQALRPRSWPRPATFAGVLAAAAFQGGQFGFDGLGAEPRRAEKETRDGNHKDQPKIHPFYSFIIGLPLFFATLRLTGIASSKEAACVGIRTRGSPSL